MSKLTKEEILEIINEFIVEENGQPIEMDSFLTDSDMDSFAYAIFWFKICDRFDCVEDDYYKEVNYVTYEVIELINKIYDNECS